MKINNNNNNNNNNYILILLLLLFFYKLNLFIYVIENLLHFLY
ncbi:MAG: hypothetical protein N7Q72_01340 [Spiroplasma sp. Tabriz.8]|nr:hypothetical protein [Candidatus Regiella insecticola]MCZ8631887.1 hypothetical protein [Spiroplasma sp. Tabriz.8]